MNRRSLETRSSGAVFAGTDERDFGGAAFGRRTRSHGKLLCLGQPTSLNDALDELAITNKLMSRMAESQRRGAAALSAWARRSRNAAIDDVAAHTAEIFRIHSARMTQCANDNRYYIEELRKMNEAEKMVHEAERRLRGLKEQQEKLAKNIRKGGSSGGIFRRRSADDLVNVRRQLEQVTIEVQSAEAELEEAKKEMEVIKMFRYRCGMQGIADSYSSYASAASAIFGCHREITEMVPAVSTQDVMLMNYEGAPVTRNCVQRLRRALELAGQSALLPPQQQQAPSSQLLGAAIALRRVPGRPPRLECVSTPPPPYTPTAPAAAELPQPAVGGQTATVTVTAGVARGSPPPQALLTPPPRSSAWRLYPKLSPNPYFVAKQQQRQSSA